MDASPRAAVIMKSGKSIVLFGARAAQQSSDVSGGWRRRRGHPRPESQYNRGISNDVTYIYRPSARWKLRSGGRPSLLARREYCERSRWTPPTPLLPRPPPRRCKTHEALIKILRFQGELVFAPPPPTASPRRPVRDKNRQQPTFFPSRSRRISLCFYEICILFRHRRGRLAVGR